MATQAQLMKAKIAGFVASATYAHAKAIYDEVNAKWDKASKALNAFIESQGPRASMGLTPDRVKAMPEYAALKRQCDEAGEMAKAFNEVYTKRFKKEHARDIAANREAKWQAFLNS